jgi:glycosyltransferase involved in cell wall biosynthesis
VEFGVVKEVEYSSCSVEKDGDKTIASTPMPCAEGMLRKLSVLMPIYNERWTLREIVDRVLNSPVPLEIEVVAVDDASRDGSWDILQALANEDSRIKAIRHPANRGKGAAIRTAIEHMTGDVAVVQDADLEYDPNEYPLLLEPILQGNADAVFGSRFLGHTSRVHPFWHTLINRSLTLLSNMLNDLTLTDMETCYKMVRADILKRLRLSSNTFTLEPELSCRLAQWKARIYEVPISYSGRSFQEGKKIRARDGLKAIWAMFRTKYLDPQFTDHQGFYILSSISKATKHHRWILDQVKPFLGQRLLEAGPGIGNLTGMLLNRTRLLLVENDPLYVSMLKQRFSLRSSVQVDHADLTNPKNFSIWEKERLDTVLCSNVLEYLEPDEDVLRGFCQTLTPGGHCVVVVPAEQWLYNPMDKALGHCRRYTQEELRQKMTTAGFEVVLAKQFGRLGALSWAISGHMLRHREPGPKQMIWSNRLLPLAKLLEYVLPMRGMSLMMVGRKPIRQVQRMAA